MTPTPSGLCSECSKVGVVRNAHRVMPDGRKLCDEHYRADAGLPQFVDKWNRLPKKKEEATVSENINWPEVQKERDAGVSVTAIAGKYKTTTATIYNHTDGKRKPAPTPVIANNVIIADLKKVRDAYQEKIDKIDKAIEVLSEI